RTVGRLLRPARPHSRPEPVHQDRRDFPMRMIGILAWTKGARPGLLAFLVAALLASGLRAEPPKDITSWRIGPAACSFNRFTFFEAVDKTAALGLRHIEAFENQRVAPDIDAKMGADLPDAVLDRIRDKLRQSQVTLTSLYIHMLPA